MGAVLKAAVAAPFTGFFVMTLKLLNCSLALSTEHQKYLGRVALSLRL